MLKYVGLLLLFGLIWAYVRHWPSQADIDKFFRGDDRAR